MGILATSGGYHFLLIGRRKRQKNHFISRQRRRVLTRRYAGRPGGGRLLLLLLVRRRGPQVALRQPTIWIVGPLTARHNSRRRYDRVICDARLRREKYALASRLSLSVYLPADRVRLGWLDQQHSSMLFNVCPSLCSLCSTHSACNHSRRDLRTSQWYTVRLAGDLYPIFNLKI